jgi:aminoglycoside 3-N-acetyltransferase
VVRALLDALGAGETLLAYLGWADSTAGLERWPADWQAAYRAERPPFDPWFSETDRQMGRVPERIRTWPGAEVSGSHVRRMAAVGARARWVTADQPWDHAFGAGSPLAKLVAADGQVLLLGAGLDRLTLLHHAEALVDSSAKRLARHAIPVRAGDDVVWREVRDHDTSSAVGAFPYRPVTGEQDPFQVIGQLALDAGCGVAGRVGDAPCYLFAAAPLVEFAVAWLTRHFGGRTGPRSRHD